MHKLLLTFISAALVLSLVGCGDNGRPTTSGNSPTQSASDENSTSSGMSQASTNLYPEGTCYTHYVDRQYLFSYEVPYGLDGFGNEKLGDTAVPKKDFNGYIGTTIHDSLPLCMRSKDVGITYLQMFSFHDGAELNESAKIDGNEIEVITTSDLESAEALANKAEYFITHMHAADRDILAVKKEPVLQVTYGGQLFYRTAVRYQDKYGKKESLAVIYATERAGARLVFIFQGGSGTRANFEAAADLMMSSFKTYDTLDETLAVEKELVQPRASNNIDFLRVYDINEEGLLVRNPDDDATYIVSDRYPSSFLYRNISMDWTEFTVLCRKTNENDGEEWLEEELAAGSFEHPVYGTTKYRIANIYMRADIVFQNADYYAYLAARSALIYNADAPSYIDIKSPTYIANMKNYIVSQLVTAAKTARSCTGMEDADDDVGYEGIAIR